MRYDSDIIQGAGRGKKMQLPTLNFAIPRRFLYPHGIYAGYVWTGEERHRAAFHYGPIPTFNTHKPSLEAFVLAGHVDTTKPVRIEMLRYLREIQKFRSPGTLRAQIQKDIEATRSTLVSEQTDH